jgi:Ca2+-binding RTX toxin-like protein
MSRISDTTTPLEVTSNDQGGQNITGSQEVSNRLNGGAAEDLLLSAPLGDPNAGEFGSADVIDGGDGNDTIASLGGDDSVLGGVGNDIVLSNTGDDTVFGEQGQDTLLAGKGNDVVSGGLGDDVVYGDLGDDTLSGDDGNDIVLGGQGADSLSGGAGDDTLLGGEGSDTLIGGDGNDLLSGDRGADVMTGGVGNDTFAFSSYGNAANTPEAIGQDTITDFTTGSDKIGLEQSTFSAIGDTLEAAEFETTTQVDGASAAKVIYNSQTGELIYNPTTAAGDEVTIATLAGAPSINFGDFEIF